MATPVARIFALRLGLYDVPAARKTHINPVPYLGGVAIILAFCFSVGGGVVLGRFPGAYLEVAVFVALALLLAGIGLLDDLKGIPVWIKLAAQVAVGAGLYAAGVRVHLLGIWPIDVALTLIWTVGIVNAVNLLDNMDGLSAGISAIAAGTYFALAAFSGQILVAGLAIAL
ncbi:MAG: undecaprenyl/decaprenyl-phosphate alpha-N-acetylglucosaminyl 1-phosphate transferase, partial [Actinomycetota bacterium]